MYKSFLNNYESSMTMRGGEGRRRGGVKRVGVGREGEGLSPPNENPGYGLASLVAAG